MSAHAKPPPTVVVVDVGVRAAPAEVRATVEKAVSTAGRVRPHPDPLMRRAFRGEALPAAHLVSGIAAVEAAARAYGALDCAVAVDKAELAISLLATDVASDVARPHLRRAATYLLLCYDLRGEREAAAQAAAELRVLGFSAEGPPPGIPRDAWQRYPEPPATGASGQVVVRSEPAAAQVFVGLRRAGQTPLTMALQPGQHRLVVAREGFLTWYRTVVVERAEVVFEVGLQPRPLDLPARVQQAVRGLPRASREQRLGAIPRLCRDAGADRALAIEVFGTRLRARFVDATGAVSAAVFDGEALRVIQHPRDLVAFLDGGAAALTTPAAAAPRVASSSGSRPATPSKGFGRRWWHWVVGAATAAAVGVAIYAGSRSSNQEMSIRVVKP